MTGAIKSEAKIVKVQANTATHFSLRSWRCLARTLLLFKTQGAQRLVSRKDAKRRQARQAESRPTTASAFVYQVPLVITPSNDYDHHMIDKIT